MTPTPPNAGEPVASKSVIKRIAAQSGHVLKTAREVEIWFAAFEAGRAQPNVVTDPLNGFLLADAALRVLTYDLGAFGSMWSKVADDRKNEIRAGLANAIEAASFAATYTQKDAQDVADMVARDARSA